MLLATPSFGQEIPAAIGPANNGNFYGPPHNIIYWAGSVNYPNTNTNIGRSLLSACDPINGPTPPSSGCYTEVIISSVYPDPTCTYLIDNTWTGIFNANLVGSIVYQLHQAGKTVLLSVGGQSQVYGQQSGIPSANYNQCILNGNGSIWTLASMIVNLANQYGFDGIDIDFEDTTAFGDGYDPQLYDGIWFLEALTENIAQNPAFTFPHNIITHAPQTAYWTMTYNSAFGNYTSPLMIMYIGQKAPMRIITLRGSTTNSTTTVALTHQQNCNSTNKF
jgi:hypothetical protein